MKKFVIVAVDDNKDYLESLRQFFSKYKDRYDLSSSNCISKFEVEYNVEFMLEKIKNIKPDVVLMDFSFTMTQKPNDYGVELVRRIKQKFPEQHIIMLVEDDDDQSEIRWDKIKRSFDAGASAYLGKNELSNCMEAIDEVVKGETFVSKESMETFKKAYKDKKPSEYDLTPRQREVLQVLSKDFSIGETAARLEGEDRSTVTPHVVNFHLQNIRRRLNTRTLHGTIAKAIRENLI